MNPLVKKAFESLAVTCNTTALHPSDEDRVKVTLKALHKNNVVIDVNELKSWLISSGWEGNPVKNITSWAEKITTGGRVQIKHKNMAPTENDIWKQLNA